MSLHATLFAAAGIGQLLRAQGEAITYTEPDRQAVPLTALVGSKQVQRKDGDRNGSTYEHVRTFTFIRDPDDAEFGGVESPQKNAIIAHAGESYQITGIESQTATDTQVNVRHVAQANLSAPDTRRRK